MVGQINLYGKFLGGLLRRSKRIWYVDSIWSWWGHPTTIFHNQNYLHLLLSVPVGSQKQKLLLSQLHMQLAKRFHSCMSTWANVKALGQLLKQSGNCENCQSTVKALRKGSKRYGNCEITWGTVKALGQLLKQSSNCESGRSTVKGLWKMWKR